MISSHRNQHCSLQLTFFSINKLTYDLSIFEMDFLPITEFIIDNIIIVLNLLNYFSPKQQPLTAIKDES